MLINAETIETPLRVSSWEIANYNKTNVLFTNSHTSLVLNDLRVITLA